jgi:hypothetical protein
VTRPDVTVITLTRERPVELLRAARSVVRQQGVSVEHLIVGDDCSALADPAVQDEIRRVAPSAIVMNVPRTAQSAEFSPARQGALRNLATARASAQLIAHLDDDNEYEPDHLASLERTLAETPGAEAAHSWRKLFYPDGTPFVLAGVDPWLAEEAERAESFARMEALGVFVAGSNVVRDRLDAGREIIPRIDTSEWLLTRALTERIPWPASFSRGQERLVYSEDLLLAVRFRRLGVKVVCSRRATLRYFMGGQSTRDAVEE